MVGSKTPDAARGVHSSENMVSCGACGAVPVVSRGLLFESGTLDATRGDHDSVEVLPSSTDVMYTGDPG